MMTTTAEPQVYTVRGLAAAWHVHPETIYDSVKRGQIRALRLGKKILIPRAEVERLLAGATEATA